MYNYMIIDDTECTIIYFKTYEKARKAFDKSRHMVTLKEKVNGSWKELDYKKG